MGWRLEQRGRRGQAFVSAVVVLAVYAGYLALPAAAAEFTGTTQSTGSSFGTGSLAISDDDSGSAMFGGVVTSTATVECIAVTYTGMPNATVKLYGSVGGDSGIHQYVTLKVEEGTGGSSSSCSGFSATSTPFNATVNTWSATQFSNGLLSWTTTGNQTKTYRFSLSVGAGTPIAQQGSQVALAFTWEAQAGA